MKVAICGSFRRDQDGLRGAYDELLDSGAAVLSPVDPDFVLEEDGFAFAAHEIGERPADVEARHLLAMQAADFVWLHAPNGYVGPSAAMELGFAHAVGLPVYAEAAPGDPVLAEFVRVVERPASAVAARTPGQSAEDAPTRALWALQQYYRRAALERGWEQETAQETLLLLTEEVGELTRAVRKTRNGLVHGTQEDPALELADVALYVVHLANVLEVDLAEAVSVKERINAERFGTASTRAAA